MTRAGKKQEGAGNDENLEKPNTLEKIMKCMEEMIKMIKDTMEMLQHEILDLKTMVERETEKRRKVLHENEDLRGEINFLKAETNTLKKIDELEQDQLSFDIVISNIEQTEVSSPSDTFKGLVNKTLMTEVVQDSDIARINVVRSKEFNKMTLIATLTDMSTKNAIMSQRKLFMRKKLYVKDNLTQHRYKLLKATKEFARANDYKFSWVKHGDIYLRKDEGTRVHRIRSMECLHRISINNSNHA